MKYSDHCAFIISESFIISVYQFLQTHSLCRSLNEQNQVCELCTFSQIQSYICIRMVDVSQLLTTTAILHWTGDLLQFFALRCLACIFYSVAALPGYTYCMQLFMNSSCCIPRPSEAVKPHEFLDPNLVINCVVRVATVV